VGVLGGDGEANGYRSSDGGLSFTPWAPVPHLRALAERGDALFAAADDIKDGFALGVSLDGGLTFRPRLRYADVSSVAACVRRECRMTCETLAGIKLWPSELCLDPAASDAGAPDAAAPNDGAARVDARAEAASPSSPGSGCAVARMPPPRAGRQGVDKWGLALLGAFCSRSPRSKRGKCSRRRSREMPPR